MCLLCCQGYGNMAPLTAPGRIATVIYGLFGIPLFLIVLINFGATLKRLVLYIWGYVLRLSKRARDEHWVPSDAEHAERQSLDKSIVRYSLDNDNISIFIIIIIIIFFFGPS